MNSFRVGYACIHMTFNKKYRTFRLKTLEDYDVAKIKEIVEHNILLLQDILFDNIKNNIYVYRVTADIIPFWTNEIMKKILEENGILEQPKIRGTFHRIRAWQEQYNLRISMHANHFINLTTPREDVLKNSIKEIQAQGEFLRQINGLNLIIHLGGAYGDKEQAKKRFITAIDQYSEQIPLDLLTLENDDKTYHSGDIVEVCKERNLKWVYDFHHERCNPTPNRDIVALLKNNNPDKYHLSSGVDGQYKPPHADYIHREDMEAMLQQLKDAHIKEADIILEAKKKNLAITPILKPLRDGYWTLRN